MLSLQTLRHRASLMRRFVTSPIQYCRIRSDQRSYRYTLSRVTRMESAWDLRNKIEILEEKLMAL